MRLALTLSTIVTLVSLLPRATVADPPSQPQAQYSYVATPTGNCSVSCGEGVRATTLQCVNRRREVVAPSFCSALQAIATPAVPCRQAPCETYRLHDGPWSNCSVPCPGPGVKTRALLCKSNRSGSPVDLARCDGSQEGDSGAASGMALSAPCNTNCSVSSSGDGSSAGGGGGVGGGGAAAVYRCVLASLRVGVQFVRAGGVVGGLLEF